jgi:hypothetical protein
MKKILRISIAFGYLLIIIQFPSYNLISQVTNSKLDSLFDPEITSPAYSKNEGPTIYLDEGHYNRHTYGGLGSFSAFRNVLVKDGYQVVSFKDQFTTISLQDVGLMIIALAQNKKNLDKWYNPTFSAFTHSEIIEMEKWVKKGGSLFLIVDHHPFAGAAEELAKEFGFRLFNGLAEDTIRYPSYFHRANRTLQSNVITNGRNDSEKIDSVLTFSGSAIKLSNEASSILSFDNGWIQRLPDTAWNYNNIEPVSISGFSQGAFKEFGKGKVVIFADGNMFSAQDTSWGGKMGFINPNAKYNYKLLLNIVHYLDGLLD